METFGRYELIKKIATGGMAEIYLARQAGIDGFEKLLVLKRILPHLAESDEFVEMFLHEARVAVRLNHPNIVQIFDLGEIDGAYFIAMEYIHGEDARRIWRQSEQVGNPIPVPLVCRIVMDAAAGLDYAHKRTDASGQPLNIIHRDVSPQNILISFEGAVKVVDFGIAKAADQATQTRSGVLKGKFSYMSPEQASGKEIDQRSDQFALGIIFYELLTFSRLFKRSNDIQTLTAVSECKVLPPSEVNPRIPKDLDPIVMRALSKNRDERFRDLAEMQMAIEEWLLAHQQASSAAHLSAFLKAIYAERLTKELEVGSPVFHDGSEPSGSVASRLNRRRQSLSSLGQVPLADQTRNAHRSLRVGAAATYRAETGGLSAQDSPKDDDEPTPVELEPISVSSPSALLPKRGVRKRFALAVGLLALLAGGAGAFFALPHVLGTTERPVVEVPARPVPVPPVPQPPKPRLAGIKVVTVPPGARVVVDGRPQEELTPITVAGLGLGDHQVFIELKGYLDEQRAVVLEEEGTIAPLSVELRADASQRLVSLIVESTPPGAEVLLDGVPSGRTPATLSVGSERTVSVELRREGFLGSSRQVKVGSGPEQRLGFTLERRVVVQAPSGPATVSIECQPPAVVWEGKSQLGETPFRGKLPAGKHRLVLVNRELGFERVLPLVLRPGESVSRSFKLEQGEVQIVATPWADVYLRNKKIGTTPMPKLTLYEGEHQFTLVNTDLGKKKLLSVTVRAGQLEKTMVDMAAE